MSRSVVLLTPLVPVQISAGDKMEFESRIDRLIYVIQAHYPPLPENVMEIVREFCHLRGDDCFVFGRRLIPDPYAINVNTRDLRGGVPERAQLLCELLQQVGEAGQELSVEHALKVFKMVEVVFPHRVVDTHPNPAANGIRVTYPDGDPMYYLLDYAPFESVETLAGGDTATDWVSCLAESSA